MHTNQARWPFVPHAFLSVNHGYPKEFFCKAISVHVEVDMHEMYQPRKGKMSVFLIVEKPG